jgi:hypothetical protein
VVELKPAPASNGKAKIAGVLMVTGAAPIAVKEVQVVVPLQVTDVVATLAKVFGPEKYERLLITPADEVPNPLNERALPVTAIGKVAVNDER